MCFILQLTNTGTNCTRSYDGTGPWEDDQRRGWLNDKWWMRANPKANALFQFSFERTWPMAESQKNCLPAFNGLSSEAIFYISQARKLQCDDQAHVWNTFHIFVATTNALHSSASQKKSISTKILWGFIFVPRTPKITTFWNSKAAPCTEALFCF